MLNKIMSLVFHRPTPLVAAWLLLLAGCLAPLGETGTLLSAWAPGIAAKVLAAGDLASDDIGGSEVGWIMGQLTFQAWFALGDNAYPHGSSSDYLQYWLPAFGRYDSQVFPTPGNHDYDTPGAAGYKSYFDSRAEHYPTDAEFYSFDLGGWRWFSLNSEIRTDSSSRQFQWLNDQLQKVDLPRCVGAYWHRPLFTIGITEPAEDLRPLWNLLAEHNVDLVLVGHDHNYQRWSPIDGITEMVIGTGGRFRYPFSRADMRVAKSDQDHYGIVQFALSAEKAEFRFVSSEGVVLDSGVVACH
jgi:hypothetical protein